MNSTTAVLRRLVRDRLRDYAGRYLLALLFMAMVAGTTALSAYIMKDVINRIFVERNPTAMTWIPLIIVAIFVAKGLASYLQEVTLARIGNSIVADTQKRLYHHLLQMDAAFYQEHPSSDLTMRIALGAGAAREMLNLVAVSLGRDLLTLIGLVAVMITMSPVLAGIALLVGPFASIGLRRMTRLVKKATSSGLTSQTSIIGLIRETSQGVRIVKSFQLEPVLEAKMSQAVETVEKVGNRVARTQAGVNPLIEMLGGFAIALVVAYAGWRTMGSTEAPGELFAFITSLLLASDPARRLSKMQIQLAGAAVNLRRMYELIDAPATERPIAGQPDLVVTHGAIRFEGVGFGYRADGLVLDGLTLGAKPGSVTALVGPSGGGKTTVFSLLQRFWPPNAGQISIDGQDIQSVALASLRRKIALVSQDVFLFEGTIRENIAAGRSDVTEAEIRAAARHAHAHDFIESLPLAYDTPVGELGSQISGGQRQRLSIARAFLKNAPIVLLDEPTSALDSESEQAVQTALAELTQGRTTLVIAHRLSTILHADAIHVIEGGGVVESGTHAELIARNGVYARLYRLQFGAGEAAARAAAAAG